MIWNCRGSWQPPMAQSGSEVQEISIVNCAMSEAIRVVNSRYDGGVGKSELRDADSLVRIQHS